LFYWTFTNGFSLLQANVLRLPAVKSLLGIPIPPPVPAPPGKEGEPENPSHIDTFKKLKSTLTDRWSQATDQAALLAEKQEREKGLRRGTLGMTERIKETGAQVKAAGEAAAPITPTPTSAPSGFLEETTAKPAGTTTATEAPSAGAVESNEHLSRDEVKRQRIAAARERRARQ
jgi:YidC/Oxa1 family membrane protein insertase